MIEFGIYTKTLLANSIRETHCRWAVEEYTNNSKIEVIMTLTPDLITKISTNKKDFITVYYCQVIEINSLDKGNINNISKDIIKL